MTTPPPNIPQLDPAAGPAPAAAGAAPPSKLELENQSLKRRLVQYANTLEQLTGHAKREISTSARARDDAIAAAADAATLRATLAETTTARDRATSASAAARAEADDLRSRLAAVTAELRETSARSDSASRAAADLRASRDRLADTDARLERALERAARAESASRDSTTLAENAARDREELVTRAERNARDAAAAAQREAAARATSVRLKEEVARVESDLSAMRSDLEVRARSVKASEERVRVAEGATKAAEIRLSEVERRAEDTRAALRRELDEVLKEVADRNAELAELRERAARGLDDGDAVEERDVLRCNVRDLQEELEQSTEMLTRAAIDALGDKSRIRKLEDALGKTRDDLLAERRERASRDAKIAGLVEEVGTLERQLDSLRSSKRALADECHRYQMAIHEKEGIVAAKSKELEEIGTERNDRAFHADRLSLELSNSKNALAKKESDYVNLSSEYDDVCEQLKTTAKDLEDRHVEIGQARRELASVSDQILVLNKEKERMQSEISELSSSRRNAQELATAVAEKDEELSSVKRMFSALKTESGETAREKKRLSDMLADVSGDLQRANQEVDLLRGMRKEHEALAARISDISETSTRELNNMRASQSEQAERLARNTVEEYSVRMEEMQRRAQDDIASTVASQLREAVMPQLMRAVDLKAKRMAKLLAKQVEALVGDDDEEDDDLIPRPRDNDRDMRASTSVETAERAESLLQTRRADTNVATAGGSASESRSAPISVAGGETAYLSETASLHMSSSMYGSAALSSGGYTRSGSASHFAGGSTAESRWNSIIEGSRVGESVEGSTSAVGVDNAESIEASVDRSLHRDYDDSIDGIGSRRPGSAVGTTAAAAAAAAAAVAAVGLAKKTMEEEEDDDDDDDDPLDREEADVEPVAPEMASRALGLDDDDETGLGTTLGANPVAPRPMDDQDDDDAHDDDDVDGDTAKTEEVVEELDITQEGMGEEEEEEDDDGVDIELQFDARELLRQRMFASNMMDEEDDDDDDDDDEDWVEDDHEEEGDYDDDYDIEGDDPDEGDLEEGGDDEEHGDGEELGDDEEPGNDVQHREFIAARDFERDPEDHDDRESKDELGSDPVAESPVEPIATVTSDHIADTQPLAEPEPMADFESELEAEPEPATEEPEAEPEPAAEDEPKDEPEPEDEPEPVAEEELEAEPEPAAEEELADELGPVAEPPPLVMMESEPSIEGTREGDPIGEPEGLTSNEPIDEPMDEPTEEPEDLDDEPARDPVDEPEDEVNTEPAGEPVEDDEDVDDADADIEDDAKDEPIDEPEDPVAELGGPIATTREFDMGIVATEAEDEGELDHDIRDADSQGDEPDMNDDEVEDVESVEGIDMGDDAAPSVEGSSMVGSVVDSSVVQTDIQETPCQSVSEGAFENADDMADVAHVEDDDHEDDGDELDEPMDDEHEYTGEHEVGMEEDILEVDDEAVTEDQEEDETDPVATMPMHVPVSAADAETEGELYDDDDDDHHDGDDDDHPDDDNAGEAAVPKGADASDELAGTDERSKSGVVGGRADSADGRDGDGDRGSATVVH